MNCPECHGAATIENTEITDEGRLRELSCNSGCGRFETIRAWCKTEHEFVGWIDYRGKPKPSIVMPTPNFAPLSRGKRADRRQSHLDREPEIQGYRYTARKQPDDAQYKFGSTYYKRGIRDNWFAWNGDEWRRFIHEKLPQGAEKL